MKIKFLFLISLLSVILLTFSSLSSPQHTADSIIENMSQSIVKIKTLSFRMKKKERIDGRILTGEQQVKFNHTPRKIYTKVLSPNTGAEVLYIDGQNKNQAYINPNDFPYITLSLDPYGSIMRKNNHHTVHEVGFDYINGIVKYIREKSDTKFSTYFQYIGDTLFDNKRCYKILIDYLPFNYENYIVKQGETLKEIGYKLFVSDYMIMSVNPEIDSYNDVKPGQVIKVPNAYCRKTILYIDQETNLPLVQIMYDEKGLFAQYEFYDLILNPSFSALDFSRENDSYDF